MQQKQIPLLLFFMLLCSSLAYAQTTLTLFKQSYLPGETVQAEITTANPEQPLAPKQIALLDNKQQKVSMAPFLLQKEKNYYVLYFDLLLPLQEGNYSLEVQDIPYIINNTLQKITMRETITVIGDDVPILAISPGFFLLKESEEDISLQVESKQKTTNIQFTTTKDIRHVYTLPQIVQEGTKRAFKFILDKAILTEAPSITFTYGNQSYIIPVLFHSATSPVPQQPTIQALEFLVEITIVNQSITKQQTMSGPLPFRNTLNESLYNLTITLTGNLGEIATLNRLTIPLLPAGAEDAVYVWINREKQPARMSYYGDIVLTANKYSISLPVLITISAEEVEEPEEEPLVLEKQPEEEKKLSFPLLPGEGKPVLEQERKGMPLGLVVFLILFAIAILLFFLFKRKKTVQETSFADYMRKIGK